MSLISLRVCIIKMLLKSAQSTFFELQSSAATYIIRSNMFAMAACARTRASPHSTA